MSAPFDFLIIGSGAGGAAAAYKLTRAGSRVLLLEKGPRLPDDGSTLDPQIVLREGRYKSHEIWQDAAGRDFMPEEYFNLGGKTRWYGAALLRFQPGDFVADSARQLLPWPFAAEELRPYYEEAESLLQVGRFDAEPDLARIAARLTRGGWQADTLPMGLSPAIHDNENAATHYDGYAVPNGLKADAQYRLLDRVSSLPNLQIETGAEVASLLPSADDALRIAGVRLVDGREFLASTVLLAGGALHSPRLLQAYITKQGLAGHLSAASSVGRNFKKHILTAVLGFSPMPQNDRLRKTLLITNSRFPSSSVQPLGGWTDRDIVRSVLPRWLPGFVTEFFARRVYGFFLQTEDGSHVDNRVVSTVNGGKPALLYAPKKLPQHTEHRSFVAAFCVALLRARLLPVAKPVPLAGTAHACGTLVTGLDPATSVVDGEGRVHGMANLYVVDGSVLPRSSRMNPALTIYAWSLRVADRLLADKGIKKTARETVS